MASALCLSGTCTALGRGELGNPSEDLFVDTVAFRRCLSGISALSRRDLEDRQAEIGHRRQMLATPAIAQVSIEHAADVGIDRETACRWCGIASLLQLHFQGTRRRVKANGSGPQERLSGGWVEVLDVRDIEAEPEALGTARKARLELPSVDVFRDRVTSIRFGCAVRFHGEANVPVVDDDIEGWFLKRKRFRLGVVDRWAVLDDEVERLYAGVCHGGGDRITSPFGGHTAQGEDNPCETGVPGKTPPIETGGLPRMVTAHLPGDRFHGSAEQLRAAVAAERAAAAGADERLIPVRFTT